MKYLTKEWKQACERLQNGSFTPEERETLRSFVDGRAELARIATQSVLMPSGERSDLDECVETPLTDVKMTETAGVLQFGGGRVTLSAPRVLANELGADYALSSRPLLLAAECYAAQTGCELYLLFSLTGKETDLRELAFACETLRTEG